MVVDIALGKIILLAGADAVNPCAFAVLILILIMLASASNKKSTILRGGLAFISAVFIGYFIYGLLFIGAFKWLGSFTSLFHVYAYNILAVFAMILGALNIKDALWYSPGGVMTEMPMKLRPRLRIMVKGITSPKGAFFIGIFVTLFLLPCTIGPYIIASEILSTLDILSIIPWLVLYNFVFVLPMMVIVLLIYFGYTSIEKAGGWKEQNIRWMHLVAGALLFIVGLLMLLGVI
jgi:cytochrome c biogenesis protein CcdA